MLALVAAVFVASVVGSLHCAGMCGAFLAFATAETGGKPVGKARLSVAYHGGRLVTYTLLGMAAGAAGALLDLGGSLAGFSRVAALLAGSVMIGFGVVALMHALGRTTMRMPAPKWMQKMLSMGHRAAMGFTPTRRALTIGLLTTLLPCGWLYAFSAVAAGTASPLWGGLTMAVFWAGTLPVMVSLGLGLQKATGAVGRKLPLATAVLLIAVGLWSLLGRAGLDAQAFAAAPSAVDPAMTPSQRVDAATDSAPPCCRVEP
ncbi:MAG: sulfite exporter TauE/SafE family protein [Planctomycetota bacterium]